MHNSNNTIKLYDTDNNLLPDFDSKIDEIEKSIHGNNYFDKDEDYVDTRLFNKKEIHEIQENIKEKKEIKNTNTSIKINKIEEKQKAKFTDFLPVLFFIIMFVIIVYAGYYFLNDFDFSKLLNK